MKCYYDTCSEIDRHNKKRQDDLELERTIGTHDWWKHVAISIFGMIVVDTMNFHQACAHPNDIDANPDEFITGLEEEMTDNTLDVNILRSRSSVMGDGSPYVTACRQPVRRPHATPTKEKKRKRSGKLTSYSLQGNCNVCGSKTTHVCSECDRIRAEKPYMQMTNQWYCHKKCSRDCFDEHLNASHPVQ